MDPFVNEKDFSLLDQDHYTFAVLTRILKGECELIRSNHKNLLVCHSASLYPVWIWTPDHATDEVKKAAWELVRDLRPLANGCRYNLKYELAEYFIEMATGEGLSAGITRNMFVYDCPSPIPPDAVSDGGIHCCTMADAEVLCLVTRTSCICRIESFGVPSSIALIASQAADCAEKEPSVLSAISHRLSIVPNIGNSG